MYPIVGYGLTSLSKLEAGAQSAGGWAHSSRHRTGPTGHSNNVTTPPLAILIICNRRFIFYGSNSFRIDQQQFVWCKSYKLQKTYQKMLEGFGKVSQCHSGRRCPARPDGDIRSEAILCTSFDSSRTAMHRQVTCTCQIWISGWILLHFDVEPFL